MMKESNTVQLTTTPALAESPCYQHVPLWTMIAERGGWKYHLAKDDFEVFCKRTNMCVRDYVELRNGKICQVYEGGHGVSEMNQYNICKQCLKYALRHCW